MIRLSIAALGTIACIVGSLGLCNFCALNHVTCWLIMGSGLILILIAGCIKSVTKRETFEVRASSSPENSSQVPLNQPLDSQYSSEEVKQLLSKDDFQNLLGLNELLIANQEFAAYDIAEFTKKTVYALIYHHTDPEICFFTSSYARDAFIAEKLEGFSDVTREMSICFGMPENFSSPAGNMDEAGVQQKYHLKNFLVNPGDAFTFEAEIGGEKRFLWLYRSRDLFNHGIKRGLSAASAEERTHNMLYRNGMKRTDLTDFINQFDHEIVSEALGTLEQQAIAVPFETGELRIQENIDFCNQKIDLVCGLRAIALDDHETSIRIFPAAEENSKEFSYPLGVFLARQACDSYTKERNRLDKKIFACSKELSQGEFRCFPRVYAINSERPALGVFFRDSTPVSLYIIVVKHPDCTEWHFFKTQEAQDQYKTQLAHFTQSA